MKKISYSTTMAILLAGSMAIMPVFAAEQIDADLEDDCGCQHARSLEESLDQQLVPDSTSFGVAKAIRKGLKAENKSITYQRRNIQTAPTFGDVLKAPFRLVSNGIGSLIQSTLCAGGVKTFVKYDQPVSAFEIAAFDRINQVNKGKKLQEELRQLEVLAKKAGIKNLATLAQQFGIDLTSALRQLNTRCITARAHEDAVAQRYENDRKYIRQLLSKNTEMLPKYVRDNHELLRALIPNEKAKISKEDQDLVIVPRGLGVLPGTHAVLKCGYHYNILSGLARCCPPTHYDLTVDSAIGKAGRFPAILNQGGTESCVAQAFSSALNFARRAQGLPDQTPARSFIWSWTRQIGSSGHAFDGGAHKYLGNWGCSMNIAGDLVGTQGAPSEESDYGCNWYSDMKAHADADNTMTRYDSAALSAAAHGETDVASGISFIHQSDTNSLTANVNAIRYALYGGYPVLIGIDVRRSSYYNDAVATSGDFVMPFSDDAINNSIDFDHPIGKNDDGTPIYGAGDFSVGGHAILLVGYNDDKQTFRFMNSWGTWWGDNGYGTLPYQYVCGTSTSYSSVEGISTPISGKNPADKLTYYLNNTPFSPAPYAGYFGQIKSCTK